MRKLRQMSSNLEEENALLSRHVENMKCLVERVQKEVEKQESQNQKLQSHLQMMREVLASAFKDVTLPGSVEPPPTVNTMDHLMGKLQSSLWKEMGKHPLLVEKVSSMAKHLERVLQEKVSPDALKGTSVALEGVETGEEEGDPLYMYTLSLCVDLFSLSSFSQLSEESSHQIPYFTVP